MSSIFNNNYYQLLTDTEYYRLLKEKFATSKEDKNKLDPEILLYFNQISKELLDNYGYLDTLTEKINKKMFDILNSQQKEKVDMLTSTNKLFSTNDKDYDKNVPYKTYINKSKDNYEKISNLINLFEIHILIYLNNYIEASKSIQKDYWGLKTEKNYLRLFLKKIKIISKIIIINIKYTYFIKKTINQQKFYESLRKCFEKTFLKEICEDSTNISSLRIDKNIEASLKAIKKDIKCSAAYLYNYGVNIICPCITSECKN